jgi:hypothetical protein
MYLLLNAISSSFHEISKRDQKISPNNIKENIKFYCASSSSPALLSVEN